MGFQWRYLSAGVGNLCNAVVTGEDDAARRWMDGGQDFTSGTMRAKTKTYFVRLPLPTTMADFLPRCRHELILGPIVTAHTCPSELITMDGT